MNATRLALVCIVAIVPAAAATAEPPSIPAATPATAAARVTYVSTSSVYVSTGSDEGVAIGDRFEVVRDDAVVATLVVTLTSTHKSECRRLLPGPEIVAGDTLRYLADPAPAPEPPPPAPEPGPDAAPAPSPTPEPAPDPAPAASTTLEPAPQAPQAAPPGPGPMRALGLRGRIGVRFMAVQERDGGPDYYQPAIDFRLDGTRVAGSDFDLYADFRARRSYRSFSDGDTQTANRTRTYRLAGAWQPAGSPFRLSFGRQIAPSLSVVSLFDGVLGEVRKGRWGGGVFAGSQPDPGDFGYSTEVREYGGFVEYGSEVGAKRRWAVTGGPIASYDQGVINREFVFLQARYNDRRLSGFLTQEVDLNRGWRLDQEGSTWTATSGYLSVRWRAADTFALNGGYDSRRNVRLYRDYVSPETDFDDAYRRGAWIGVDGRAGAHFDYGVSFRRSDVEGEDTADATTILLGVRRLTSSGLDLSLRATRYTNQQMEGWLTSLACGSGIGARSHLEAYGGVRDETVLTGWVPEERHTWYGLNWDLFAGRHWMFTVTAERNLGQDENNDQVYATTSYRF